MNGKIGSLFLLSLASGLFRAGATGQPVECRVAETLPPAHSATLDERFQALFDMPGPGWTGGDSTYSVLLPDGRTAWLFSDTFLGVVDARGGRHRFSPLVNNTIVVQDGTSFTTLHGGDLTLPDSFFPAPAENAWYWQYDGTVERTEEGEKLRIFLLHFRRAGDGVFGFQWVGTAIATLSLPELELEGIVPAPSDGGVSWGAALLEEDEHLYIYGTEDLGDDKYMHLARAPRDGVLGAWEFWDGAAWTNDAGASARLLHGVANEYSVTAHAGGYVLVTMDTSTRFSPHLVVWTSCTPTGPWENRTVVFDTPETGGNDGNLITYNAHAHPQFAEDGQWLISYNVNSLTFGDLFLDVNHYRPRFIRVRFGPEPAGE